MFGTGGRLGTLVRSMTVQNETFRSSSGKHTSGLRILGFYYIFGSCADDTWSTQLSVRRIARHADTKGLRIVGSVGSNVVRGAANRNNDTVGCPKNLDELAQGWTFAHNRKFKRECPALSSRAFVLYGWHIVLFSSPDVWSTPSLVADGPP